VTNLQQEAHSNLVLDSLIGQLQATFCMWLVPWI